MTSFGNSSIHGNSKIGTSEQHPYDTPYSKMMEMRKDIQELRSLLLAEQQQRAAEVTELRHEVHLLREALRNEAGQREAVVERLMRDLAPAQKTNDFEQWRNDLRHKVDQLEHDLADEIRDRKAADTMRDTREAARDADIRGTLNSLCKEFTGHKQVLSTVKHDHRELINSCVHDLHLIASGMQRITQAWVSMPLSQLKTSDGNGNSGVPQFSTTQLTTKSGW